MNESRGERDGDERGDLNVRTGRHQRGQRRRKRRQAALLCLPPESRDGRWRHQLRLKKNGFGHKIKGFRDYI